MAAPKHGPLLEAMEVSGGTAALGAIGNAFGDGVEGGDTGDIGSGGANGLLPKKHWLGGCNLASILALLGLLASWTYFGGDMDLLCSSDAFVVVAVGSSMVAFSGKVLHGSYSGDFGEPWSSLVLVVELLAICSKIEALAKVWLFPLFASILAHSFGFQSCSTMVLLETMVSSLWASSWSSTSAMAIGLN